MSKRTREKVAVLKTEFVTIKPKMGLDTLNGKPISNSTIPMGYHVGDFEFEHKGKKVKGSMVGGGGLTFMVEDGRQFHVNVSGILKHACDAGLLNDKIDFKESE